MPDGASPALVPEKYGGISFGVNKLLFIHCPEDAEYILIEYQISCKQ